MEDILSTIFTQASNEDIQIFSDLFETYSSNFNIISKEDQAAFLAQVKIEVGTDLVSKRENLNYSCDALVDTFSYYQEHEYEAEQDGRCNDHEANQVQIGNKAYGNRLGNGSPETGDGYRFRGGGFFQLTGRDHYTNLAKGISEKVSINVTAEELADNITKVYWGLLSAMAYWDKYCSDCPDGDINCITSAINYYTDSYNERAEAYYEILELF
jgi:putative chitinase